MMDVDRNTDQAPVLTPFPPDGEPLDHPETGEELVHGRLLPPRPDVSAIEAAGRARGLAKGIVTVCEVLEIPLDEARLATIEALDVAGLERLLDALADERYWP